MCHTATLPWINQLARYQHMQASWQLAQLWMVIQMSMTRHVATPLRSPVPGGLWIWALKKRLLSCGSQTEEIVVVSDPILDISTLWLIKLCDPAERSQTEPQRGDYLLHSFTIRHAPWVLNLERVVNEPEKGALCWKQTHRKKERKKYRNERCHIRYSAAQCRIPSHIHAGERLRDFYIGVTNDSPVTVTPTTNPTSYPVCFYYTGAFPSGTRDVIVCDDEMTGRYVVIQLTTSESLALCEVEIYRGEYDIYTRGT